MNSQATCPPVDIAYHVGDDGSPMASIDIHAYVTRLQEHFATSHTQPEPGTLQCMSKLLESPATWSSFPGASLLPDTTTMEPQRPLATFDDLSIQPKVFDHNISQILQNPFHEWRAALKALALNAEEKSEMYRKILESSELLVYLDRSLRFRPILKIDVGTFHNSQEDSTTNSTNIAPTNSSITDDRLSRERIQAAARTFLDIESRRELVTEEWKKALQKQMVALNEQKSDSSLTQEGRNALRKEKMTKMFELISLTAESLAAKISLERVCEAEGIASDRLLQSLSESALPKEG